MRQATSLALVLLCAPAAAQSFNIDFGPAGSQPPSTYAAAGLPGTWNSLQIPHTSASSLPQAVDEFLVDLGGNATSVRVHQFGGMDLRTEVDPSVTGDDALLLLDGQVTYSASLETCLFFNGLQNGTYEVLTYAWRPNHPTYSEKVRFDFVSGNVACGGAWTGQHVEGVTYTRHVITVTSGYLGPHVGVLSGFDPATGSMACGMQLRRLGPGGTQSEFCHGDGGDQAGCTACPCGNDAAVGTRGGCVNGNGTSARLVATGEASAANDSLRFELTGGVPGALAVLLSGDDRAPTSPANPCFGADSGLQSANLDGLRCVVSGIRRHGGRAIDAAGAVGAAGPGWGPPDAPAAGLVAQGGFSAGQTRHWQVLHRELPTAGCGKGLNTSNGVSVSFLP